MKNKLFKRIISAVMTVVLLICLSSAAFAKTAPSPEKYPFIFVHGMMGFGEGVKGVVDQPYFALEDGTSVCDYFRSQGLKAYAPSNGPLSSAWDRACELFAELTGTVVDYGAAHSTAHGHARYGRDYTGRAVMGKPWNLKDKLNFVGHSFGGPTLNLFTNLLAYGCEEEIKAAPSDCSELFKGGHAQGIYSVTTLAGVLNGTPMAEILNAMPAVIKCACVLINIFGLFKNPAIDFMLDQFGVTADPSLGKGARFTLKGINALAASNDQCVYDMTLDAVKEMNAKCKAIPSVYYFSYSGDITEPVGNGELRLPLSGGKGITKIMRASSLLIMAGTERTYGSVYIDKSWKPNDGLVPVMSAVAPAGQRLAYAADGAVPQKGVWYVMPPVQGATHYWFMGMDGGDMEGFFDGIIANVRNTK